MGENQDVIESLRQKSLSKLAEISHLKEWDAFRVEILGKSGELTKELRSLSSIAPDQRKARGQQLNKLRGELEAAFTERKTALEAKALEEKLQNEAEDITIAGKSHIVGTLHPVMSVMDEIETIFAGLGFERAEGPNIETSWHNFSALNTPEEHPARAEGDTFYLPTAEKDPAKRPVLRTQTSGVQIRTLLDRQPPFRIIAPGRTYRNDHDATHSPMFHQCEGLVVGKNLGLGHLKYTIETFLKHFFEDPTLPLRFRTSYFPFTVPSLEIDIGMRDKKGNFEKWLEVLGAGMVHPQVLANCGVDPEIYNGFAFGMGIERLAMLKYGIDDLRAFYASDLRWLRHHGFSAFTAPSFHHFENNK
ncbi:phenylalanine--tRNA ligase subunit alpha [Acetobacteraceae bacterium]|nr:phenylalanine--tRNA ligase subunit alpha [Acetobacteraceae bacterium]